VRLVRKLGQVAAFVLFSATLAGTAVAYLVSRDAIIWGALRGLSGMCIVCVFILLESAMHQQAASKYRGRVVAVYSIVGKLFFAIGQAMIAITHIPGAAFFIVCALCFAVASVPATQIPASAPPSSSGGIWVTATRLMRRSPSAVLGCLGSGLMNSSMLSLAPVYALAEGLSFSAAALVAAAMQLTSVALQWPLGWLSDRTERKKSIVLVLLMTGLGAAMTLLPIQEGRSVLLVVSLTAAGGLSLSLYSVSASLAFDQAEKSPLVSLSSALQLIWAFGSIAGPVMSSGLMEVIGNAGLPIYIGGMSFLLALACLLRDAPKP